MEEATWRARVDDIGAIHASPLEWMEPNQREAVKVRAASALAQLLTRGCPWRARFHSEAPASSIAWLCDQDDYTVARFCLKLLAAPFKNLSPVLELRSQGRLRNDLAFHHLELASSLNDEAERMFSWPRMRWKLVDWKKDSRPYRKTLTYSSCLVRASAAYALGHLYYGCLTEGRKHVPPMRDILDEIARLERITPGVAGHFLCGCQFRNGSPEEIWTGVDMDSWILNLLRESGQEPYVPSGQSLTFYAHEIFADNLGAIETMLQMGRASLAVWTATQEPGYLKEIRPVVERMTNSQDPEVAQAIQTYLAKPVHHNGTQFLTEYAFGRMNYS